MLIGAHVSNAGGLPKAVERALERECDALQIFNQSPRMTSRTTVTPSSGTRRRTAPVPSSVPRKPWLPWASRHALTSLGPAVDR